MQSEEKRRFPRICCNVEVEYTLTQSDSCEVHTTSSKNLSRGGIRIIALEKLQVGQCVDIKFSLPETEEVIFAKGKVAWIEEFLVGSGISSTAYDSGIEFTNLGNESIEKITQLTLKPVS